MCSLAEVVKELLTDSQLSARVLAFREAVTLQ